MDKKKTFKKRFSDAGLWFIFFAIIYLIVLLKVITYRSIPENLFFGPVPSPSVTENSCLRPIEYLFA